jgi:hypothetical protein
MSEIEQAEAALRVALAIPDVAAAIADYARENLGGLDVVSVGSVFARSNRDPIRFYPFPDTSLLLAAGRAGRERLATSLGAVWSTTLRLRYRTR